MDRRQLLSGFGAVAIASLAAGPVIARGRAPGTLLWQAQAGTGYQGNALAKRHKLAAGRPISKTGISCPFYAVMAVVRPVECAARAGGTMHAVYARTGATARHGLCGAGMRETSTSVSSEIMGLWLSTQSHQCRLFFSISMGRSSIPSIST
jgi:hypothetical protein